MCIFLINDKPITVQEAPASAVAAVAGQPENPKTSVVASVLAAGYKLGDNLSLLLKSLT